MSSKNKPTKQSNRTSGLSSWVMPIEIKFLWENQVFTFKKLPPKPKAESVKVLIVVNPPLKAVAEIDGKVKYRQFAKETLDDFKKRIVEDLPDAELEVLSREDF